MIYIKFIRFWFQFFMGLGRCVCRVAGGTALIGPRSLSFVRGIRRGPYLFRLDADGTYEADADNNNI